MFAPVRALLIVVVGLVAVGCGTDQGDTASGPVDHPPVETTTSASTTTADLDPGPPATGPDWWPTDPDDLDPSAPARWTVEVLSTAPHDPAAFTQGLERLDDGRLLESTGLRGFSEVRIVDPGSGSVERSAALDDDEFGEGLTVVDDTVVQLTWQAEVARRWSLPDLAPLPSFSYEGEGWGLCLTADLLVMSDGSPVLGLRNRDTFELLSTVPVTRQGEPVAGLNELECVDDLILANVWRSAEIMVIRGDGAVLATIDASALVEAIASDEPEREVLNGIAAEADGTFSMTGKLWPTRFVVRVVDA